MFPKLIVLIMALSAIAAGLLGLRQQRLQMMHDMTRLHANLHESRQTMWDLQVRIAQQTQPTVLEQAIRRAGLDLEPLVPLQPPPRPIAASAQRSRAQTHDHD